MASAEPVLSSNGVTPIFLNSVPDETAETAFPKPPCPLRRPIFCASLKTSRQTIRLCASVPYTAVPRFVLTVPTPAAFLYRGNTSASTLKRKRQEEKREQSR